MLQKLTALSLSLLICLSLLPCQAGAMDASEDETPVQAADVEDQISPENPDAGIAPCRVTNIDSNGGGGGGINHTDPPINIPITAANGKPYLP